jgi:Pentapeptide repeats (8 copies)
MSPLPNQPPRKQSTRAGRLLPAIGSLFRWTERQAIEPLANYLDKADIFRIIEKISPVIEALGVIAIPLVIWFGTEATQKAKDESERAARAQEAVKTYLNQLSTVFLDGNLEKDERLRIVTRASTLALLNDPNMDGTHKGQVIDYLEELRLVQVKPEEPPSEKKDKSKEPIISLARANLNGVNLNLADLNGANLSDADLSEGYLIDADLRDANLSGAKLKGAKLNLADFRGADLHSSDLSFSILIGVNLSYADLSYAWFFGTDLSRANLNGVNLSHADFSGAKLKDADLIGANLFNVNLRDADLSAADLSGAKLCNTQLPPEITLDANRDCKELGITP